jgi:multidrug efflux pump subunit AcrA (membrane-fusion protein)
MQAATTDFEVREMSFSGPMCLAFPSRGWLILLGILLAASGGCRFFVKGSKTGTAGLIVVNAPESGTVRRIIVPEGGRVNAGEPVIEITVEGDSEKPTLDPGESAESSAIRGLRSADAEIELARAEAARHESEVQRLTPLVATGEGSQGQLDGERALYERAMQRLQRAQDAKRSAENGLISARQPGQSSGSTNTLNPNIRIITARASSGGIVQTVNTNVGQHVTGGEPLLTLVADQP